MEHRWGERRPINAMVRIGITRPTHLARLTDVSLSGAFLQTILPLLPLQRLLVGLPAAGGDSWSTLVAHVVRTCASGIAIEWCELAAQPVVELVRGADAAAPRVAQTPAVPARERSLSSGLGES